MFGRVMPLAARLDWAQADDLARCRPGSQSLDEAWLVGAVTANLEHCPWHSPWLQHVYPHATRRFLLRERIEEAGERSVNA